MNLKTIAKLAGVSTATVSNVINGNHHKVSQETIERVQKIIEENNYKPNATARSLASKKSKIIGVVVPNISEEENFFLNPHDAYLLALLENYIRNQGYYMMLRCVRHCKETIPLFSTWNVDGLIFFGTFRAEIEEIQPKLTVPAVFVDAYADDLDICNVGLDDRKGGYLAGRYLLSKGHRKIAFVSPDVNESGVIRERYLGFRDACAEKGVEVTTDHLFTVNTLYQSGVVAGQKIAMSDIRFTAVAVTSDIVAFGVMDGLRQSGVSVPHDVSVIGFDNLPECQYSNPKLTTISQRVDLKAKLVGENLFRLIDNKDAENVSVKSDVEVLERQSVRDLTL